MESKAMMKQRSKSLLAERKLSPAPSVQIRENSREDDESVDDDDDNQFKPKINPAQKRLSVGQRSLQDRHSFVFAPRILSKNQLIRRQKMDDITDMLKNDGIGISEKARRLYLMCEDVIHHKDCNDDCTIMKPRAYTNASLCDLTLHCHSGNEEDLKSPKAAKRSALDIRLDVPPQNSSKSASPTPSPTAHLEKRKSIFHKITTRTSVFIGNLGNDTPEPHKKSSTSVAMETHNLFEANLSDSNLNPNQKKKSKKKSQQHTRIVKSTVFESSCNMDSYSIISEEDRLSLKSHAEVFDDPSVKALTFSLFQDCLERKESNYWDSLYVLITLCKMNELSTSVDILNKTETFKQIRYLLECFNESMPIKAKSSLGDLVKSCISFFNYILYFCRLYSFLGIYTEKHVVEITEQLTSPNVYLNLSEVITEDEMKLLASMKDNLNKEVESHAPLLEQLEGMKTSNIHSTDLDTNDNEIIDKQNDTDQEQKKDDKENKKVEEVIKEAQIIDV
ncbi:uncharacterized protein LOC142351934 isoform X2 [Convolutriloba macropyga]|uniref:uncharacterized protein LOC142351934 isoform X2 n=1 Tax=Convolutriloba macropyga TaxID=536237 RepID=UPI003F5234C6